MAQLTPEQWTAKLLKQAEVIKANAPLQIAAQTVHAMRVHRIFDEGIQGAKYGGGELYVADKNLRRAGSHKGKTGKTIKTTYFKNYADLKKQQGFSGDKVNMRLTNDLQSDFANSQKTDGTGASPVGQVIKVSNDLYVEALRRSENVVKLNAGIAKFGNFIAFTQEEKTEFQRIYTSEMNVLLNR
jgi:hypothetical protein